MRKKHGFTLIELLVVVAVMGLLIAIVVPAVAESRRISKRTVCLHNLQQIGTCIQAYLQVNRDRFFYACRLPAIEKHLAEGADPPRKPLPSLPLALKNELSVGGRPGEMLRNPVFECPADQIQEPAVLNHPLIGMKGPKYYDSQDTSYEWQDVLNGVKLSIRYLQLLDIWKGARASDWKAKLKEIPIAYDFETFHQSSNLTRKAASEKQLGILNILYLDFHVETDKNKGFGFSGI